MKNEFAVCVLILVGLAGIVPIAIILSDSGIEGGVFGAAYNAILLQPWSTVVYAVLFGVGALMCFQITKPVFAVFLLPTLFAAVWPIFNFKPTVLPVPTGAIVAFGAEHETAPENSIGCPQGWSHYSQLAGRFPLGAGLGVKPDGTPLTKRLLGQDPGGDEAVSLTLNQMPAHRHHIADPGRTNVELRGDNTLARFRRHKNNMDTDLRSGGMIEPTVGLTSKKGANESHNNMPPYQIVVFCQFIGEEQANTQQSNPE